MKRLSDRGYGTYMVIMLIMAMGTIMLLGMFQIKSLGLSEQGNLQAGDRALHGLRSCEEDALLVIKKDASYVGSQSLVIDGTNCTYVIENSTGDTVKVIKITSSSGQASKKSTIKISSVTGQITIMSTTEE